MKENTCKRCGHVFHHEYGQVICHPCLKEMGDEQYKSNIESHLWAFFEKTGCKVKSVNFNIDTRLVNIAFIPPETFDYIDLDKLK